MRLSDIQESLSNDAVRQLADSSIFTGIQGSIGASAISVDEGASLNFTVATGNDATYYYWIEGVSGTVDSADFSSGWADSASRGTFSVTNGIGTFSLTLASDSATDGTETFRVKVSKASSGTEFLQSATVTINDTSLGPSQAQGDAFGYNSGGAGSPSLAALTTVDKFSFTSDGNATAVGNLSIGKNRGPAGQSSTVSGYTSGGTVPPTAAGFGSNVIDKFPFASDGTATDVGDLTVAREFVAGQTSNDNGYTSGGTYPVSPSVNIIDKFPFASDANATDVGNLFTIRSGAAGQSSFTHGYTSGGNTQVIDKFPFASDANATNVGNLNQNKSRWAGQNSNTDGYVSGGLPASNYILKFPFATDTNSSDIANLTLARYGGAGQSSSTNGYNSGGRNPPSSYNTIDKFPFASDANATDVGDLTTTTYEAAGQQY